MENPTLVQPENSSKLYSREEFVAKSNNFHLLFEENSPLYKSDIKEFLERHEAVQFARAKTALLESGSLVNEGNVEMLYDLYVVLRNKGKFSDKDLGLTYW